MRFECTVNPGQMGYYPGDVKQLEHLTTAPWSMFESFGYEIPELVEVLAHRFVARGAHPRLGALARPVPRTWPHQFKNPAEAPSAARTTVQARTVCTRDLFPECPDGPFLPVRRVGTASAHLRGQLSRAGWWRQTITPGHNQSAARAWIEEYFRSCSVKVLGEAKVKARVRGEKERHLEIVRVSISAGHSLWVCMELLAHLCASRIFRPLTEGLVASLRGRSRLWAEAEGLEVSDLVHLLPGTLALACLPGCGEVAAMRAFRGVGYQWSADVLGSFSRGVVKEPRAPWVRWLDVLRVGSGGGPDRAFERPVQALTLPA